MTQLVTLFTPARLAAIVAYVVSVAYPGINPDMRAAIVGAVTGIYVLSVAIVESVERKHSPVSQSSQTGGASAPVTPVAVKTETKVIR